MKVFHCDNCGNLVFFENVTCVRCEKTLGFVTEGLDLSAFEKAKEGLWLPLSPKAAGKKYRQCKNAVDYQVCNWMILESDPEPLCKACRLNEVIPDLTVVDNQIRWQKLEAAKRRVLYTLLRLRMNFDAGSEESDQPLRFRFLADAADGTKVMTGHARGVITVNIAEADDDERERRRVALREPFRTLLGHIRHEIAHYFWERLIQNSSHLERFRELFGDETNDYSKALTSYYQNGPAPNWQTSCVSAYASAHPWEDWAETWAHYLHIIDTIETAASFGISLRPKHPASDFMHSDPKKLSGLESDFDRVLEHWYPLTYALNELNRGMGLPDLYPFVLSLCTIDKLKFVHQIVADRKMEKQEAK